VGIRALIVALMASLLAAAVVPSSGASAEAGEGYRGDRIAVIARIGPPEDGVEALELREPDGTWRRLADDAIGGAWTMFEWSGDGERIYFWGFEDDGGQALPRVLDVATSTVRELGSDASDTISPDERWTAWRDSHDRLWIRALDGPDEIRLLSDGAIRRPVKWDPESSRLAAGFGTLHVVDLAGRRTRLSPDGLWVGNFAWSPDGHRLAVLARPDPAPPGAMSHYELWVAAGSFERVRFTGGPDVLTPAVALETESRGQG